ncbi:MAG: TonB-dependent receptor, partial [Calditrichia bacterium]|nr:TonB-dependent receptor [Calditrichia bacterium]
SDTWSSGNPELKPESGFDWDLGINFRIPVLNHFSFDVIYFDIRMKDLIQWQSINLIYMPVNVNKTRNKGLEINSSIQLIDNMLDLTGNYTYLDARNKSDDELNGKYLVYRAPHSFNLTLNWQWRFLSLNYDYRYIGKRYSDQNNTPEFELDPYEVSDLTFVFTKKYSKWQPVLSFQIKNIFDKRYEIIRLYPLPGREFRINLGVTYN